MPAGLGVPHSLLPFPGQSHLPKPPSPDTGHQPVPNPTGPTMAPSPWPDTGGLTGSGEPDLAFPSWHTLPVTLSCPSSVHPRCPQALAWGTKPAWGAFVPAHHPFPELSWLHEIGFSLPKPPPTMALPALLLPAQKPWGLWGGCPRAGTHGWLMGTHQHCAAAEVPQSLWGRKKARSSGGELQAGVRSCSERGVGTLFAIFHFS